MYLGIVVAEHLKEVLSPPRSRVTPGLHKTHLLVAGAMTAIVGFVVPCLIAGFTVGFGERGLAVVAVTLAALTVPAMLSQRPFSVILAGTIYPLSCSLCMCSINRRGPRSSRSRSCRRSLCWQPRSPRCSSWRFISGSCGRDAGLRESRAIATALGPGGRNRRQPQSRTVALVAVVRLRTCAAWAASRPAPARISCGERCTGTPPPN